jgi:putative ATP-dependent endonuclease of OLD family
MKIETLRLQNFRCFGPNMTSIAFESALTALIGGNGSGKTAVFLALCRLFGIGARQRAVSYRDFHLHPGQSHPVSGAMLQIEVVLRFPELGGLGVGAIADAVPEFFLQMAASAPGAPLLARMRLRATWTDDGTPEGAVDEDIRWITTPGEEFNWQECRRVQAAERGSIQMVYVPASRDAESQVTSLLKGRLWRAARWSEEFRGHMAGASEWLQQEFGRERPGSFLLERLTRRWTEVHEADTDTQPQLRLIENRFEDFVRDAMLVLRNQNTGQELSLDDLSDGQRSLFHIALTAATLEVERDALQMAHDESHFENEKLKQAHLTFLAIEEPENSLSPFFLSRIVRQTRDIASHPNAQVALSSHSPAILSRIEPEEVRFFRLERDTRRSSIQGIALPANDLAASQFIRLAVKAYPELYFARFVVLGEGDSERLVIPRVAQAMGIDLDPSFVPIVPLAGRYVGHFWRLLSGLGIPFATLLDLDLGRRHGGANTIRSAVDHLREIGHDGILQTYSELGMIDLDGIANMQDTELANNWPNNLWHMALESADVFLSYPVDIDFSMLHAFPTQYRVPNPGGYGPTTQPADIAGKKATTLKKNGTPQLYGTEHDLTFAWYPYLFLSNSKPETHIGALARIPDEILAAQAPAEIRALVAVIAKALKLNGGPP